MPHKILVESCGLYFGTFLVGFFCRVSLWPYLATTSNTAVTHSTGFYLFILQTYFDTCAVVWGSTNFRKFNAWLWMWHIKSTQAVGSITCMLVRVSKWIAVACFLPLGCLLWIIWETCDCSHTGRWFFIPRIIYLQFFQLNCIWRDLTQKQRLVHNRYTCYSQGHMILPLTWLWWWFLMFG